MFIMTRMAQQHRAQSSHPFVAFLLAFRASRWLRAVLTDAFAKKLTVVTTCSAHGSQKSGFHDPVSVRNATDETDAIHETSHAEVFASAVNEAVSSPPRSR